jgi:plastocyanin
MHRTNLLRLRVFAATAVTVAALIGNGVANAATEQRTVTIAGGQQFIPDVSFSDTQHFEQRVVAVRTGQSISWHNTTDEPHTISVVAASDLPRTVAQVESCQVCGPFLGQHAPNVGPDGQPAPPFVFFLDNLAPNAGPAKFDSTGDSIIVAPQGAQFPSTTGSTISDTVSAVISAPAGTTLNYMCAVHPWMQGSIRVVGANEAI